MSKKRKSISPKQRKRLLQKNAAVCCVCKERGLGVNLHHIDGNPENNDDDNIAVLCVKEHDDFHRPDSYTYFNHIDLGADKILAKKKSWEAFVEEAKKEHPKVAAVISCYGTKDFIIGMKVVYQWIDETIEFERKYQLLDYPPDKWIDFIIEENLWLGKIPVVMIDATLDVKYCENHWTSLSRYVDGNVLSAELLEDWSDKAICSIYINPKNPSLAITIAYDDKIYYEAHLRKVGSKIRLIDYKGESYIVLQSNPSIRTQVTRYIKKLVKDWKIISVLIGTGDPENPELINKIELPLVWEKKKRRLTH